MRSRLATTRGTIVLVGLAIFLVAAALGTIRGSVDRSLRAELDADLDRALRLAPPAEGRDTAKAGSLPAGTWLATLADGDESVLEERLLLAGSTPASVPAEDRPDLATVRRGLSAEVLADVPQRIDATTGAGSFRVRARVVDADELEALGEAYAAGATYVAAVPAGTADARLEALDRALLKSGIALVLGVLALMAAMRLGGRGEASGGDAGPITDHNLAERDQPDVAPAVEPVEPDAPPLEPDARPVDLVQLVRTAVADTGPAAASTTIEVDGDVALEADPVLVRELLDELLDNALRHGGPGVRIGVAVRRIDQARVELRVSDSGPGMRPASRARAREWPWKEGAGRVGIPFARAVALAHHGTLELDPSPDGGLSVTVVLHSLAEAAPVST